MGTLGVFRPITQAIKPSPREDDERRADQRMPPVKKLRNRTDNRQLGRPFLGKRGYRPGRSEGISRLGFLELLPGRPGCQWPAGMPGSRRCGGHPVLCLRRPVPGVESEPEAQREGARNCPWSSRAHLRTSHRAARSSPRSAIFKSTGSGHEQPVKNSRVSGLAGCQPMRAPTIGKRLACKFGSSAAFHWVVVSIRAAGFAG